MITPDKRRAELYSLLGDLPDADRPLGATCVSEKTTQTYRVETLALDLNGLETVPAYFIKPLHITTPAPAILYNHHHGGEYELGKEEILVGRGDRSISPYVDELIAAGYCVLCIDAWGFGERHKKSELTLFKEMLWSGRVLWGMMVYDSIRALDYLASREDVDCTRIATLGMSMGSTMAWWLSALDDRIKVCVDICCLTDFNVLLKKQGLDGHGIYYYVPSLLKHFSTIDINALIAPRPHLALAGNLDPLTPPEGLDLIDAALREVYKKAGAENNWMLMRYDVGHVETPDMRRQVMNFLRKHL